MTRRGVTGTSSVDLVGIPDAGQYSPVWIVIRLIAVLVNYQTAADISSTNPVGILGAGQFSLVLIVVLLIQIKCINRGEWAVHSIDPPDIIVGSRQSRRKTLHVQISRRNWVALQLLRYRRDAIPEDQFDATSLQHLRLPTSQQGRYLSQDESKAVLFCGRREQQYSILVQWCQC